MVDTVQTPERVVIVLASDLSPDIAVNVGACLAAGLSAASPTWVGQALVDVTGMISVSSSHLPIVLLHAPSARMNELVTRLPSIRQTAAWVSVFPAYAKSMHDAQTYWKQHATASHRVEPLLGMGIAGSKKWVNSLTGSFPLWRGCDQK